MLINIISFVIFIHTNAAFGAIKLDWSFADHPYPDRSEYTEAEVEALEAAREPGETYTNNCGLGIQAQYKIYNDRYPEFAKVADENERFLAWKYHIVADGKDWLGGCVFGMSFLTILDLIYQVELVFCGVFSRQPNSPVEKAFVDSVVEMREYLKLDVGVMMSHVLILHESGSSVNLNPDVEYYIRKSLEMKDLYDETFRTDHLEELLTRQRRAFLDAAVQNRDFDAVLDTTPPCKDRSPVKD
ncbi:MAG: hypothetical protein GKR97_16620 [Rhizobiaceae bacterium]|nr:hypothetical protein [Rhizobiaceae bacterium]